MLKEFKNFIMTGNVIDLAVAVILAGAVGLVVNGFVSDVMMPIIGHFAGGMDFADLKYILTEASVDADGNEVAENAIMWGKWVNTIINLVIVGFVLFMIVKAYNKTKKKQAEEAPAPPPGPTQEELLSEIRDLLKK
ncbi:large conductance mechanosensitive channel protein MscL [Aureitalea sp. L0-47]|jgi:large conductance mechanosensitive channel|uniref:large conductance mechanosensitive channel protein MscL n=1 Tax=Aureitalea sp. L0-47 TaxID=2816962 RepID=UPI002237D0D1|nr:large conductance mechanosensitive channel protein MscL [Aureitalea sp. L0-47]MCW5519882.1 large conductance mechanosensitive channel protein MscL [Aureitalea sp. L0-47]